MCDFLRLRWSRNTGGGESLSLKLEAELRLARLMEMLAEELGKFGEATLLTPFVADVSASLTSVSKKDSVAESNSALMYRSRL